MSEHDNISAEDIVSSIRGRDERIVELESAVKKKEDRLRTWRLGNAAKDARIAELERLLDAVYGGKLLSDRLLDDLAAPDPEKYSTKCTNHQPGATNELAPDWSELEAAVLLREHMAMVRERDEALRVARAALEQSKTQGIHWLGDDTVADWVCNRDGRGNDCFACRRGEALDTINAQGVEP